MTTFSDLEDAFEWASFSSIGINQAAYDRKTDRFLYSSDEAEVPEEDEIPEVLDEVDRYVFVPSKRELDLGRNLALEFAAEFMPEEEHLVYGYFNHSGAYSNFKNLLIHRGLLDQWHEYENSAKRKALTEWAKKNNIPLTD